MRAAAFVAMTMTSVMMTRTAAAEADEAPAVKSGGAATALAIGGTVGGFAVMALGGVEDSEGLALLGLGVATVGPSAGHFYAGDTGHGLLASGIRAGAIVTLAVGADMSFCLFDCSDKDVGRQRAGTMLAFAGLGLYAATTIYDIVDAHQAARRANRAAVATATVLTTPDGNHAPGLMLGGRF